MFNVGADQPFTLNELAREVAMAMKVEPAVQYLPARQEVVHAHSSHAKVREVFGEVPYTRLEDGLARMAEWVRQHGARATPAFGAIEVTKNLPAAWRT